MLAVSLGYPILAAGPTGSGKTHFFQLLAKFLQGTYHYASLNGSVTIHDLTQERILCKNGFEERDMILAKWLRDAQKGISVCQLDEVNAARPETLLALHPIMDIVGELNLTYSQETLKVNKNAILVMSCNEGDEYNGVNTMNMAFQNRYVKVHFPHIDNGELAALLKVKHGISKEHAECITKVWEQYMASREPDQAVIGIRVLERWAEMSKQVGLREAAEFTIVSLIATSETDAIKFIEGDLFINIPEDIS
jgi:nitric oxide reductase NorQ protein